MDGWMDGWMGGWMHEWVDGYVDRWVEGWTKMLMQYCPGSDSTGKGKSVHLETSELQSHSGAREMLRSQILTGACRTSPSPRECAMLTTSSEEKLLQYATLIQILSSHAF